MPLTLQAARTPFEIAGKVLRSIGDAVPYTVMATPPTVTRGADGANSTLLTDVNCFSANVSGPDTRLVALNGHTSPGDATFVYITNCTSSGAPATPGTGFCFSTDAEAFELRFQTVSGNTFRVAVNGQWVQSADYSITGTGGTFYYHKFDFGAGSKAPRNVEVYLGNSNNRILGVCVGPSAGTTSANNPYSVWATSFNEPKVLVWGDSWVYGIGATSCMDGWARQLALAMNIRGTVTSGVGAQGYLAVDNTGSSLTFRQRITDLVQVGPLDLVVIGPTGMNDGGANVGAFQAEVTAFATEAIELQPTALFAVFGAQRSPALQTSATINAAMKAGWTSASNWNANRMAFLDTYTPVNWWGTSTTASNWSVYDSGDHGHPNTAGHLYQSRQVLAALTKFLLSIQ